MRRQRPPKPGANVVPVGDGWLTLSNAQGTGARSEQQDAFGFSDPDDRRLAERAGVVGVVCDGMGGLALGAQASNAAVRTFLQTLSQDIAGGHRVPDALLHALATANAAVLHLAAQAGLQEQVGTTLAAVVAGPAGIWWIAAGDSRAYLYRAGRLSRLNPDHNYRRHLAREAADNRIGAREVDVHPDAHALTSYLGRPCVDEVDRNLRPLRLKPGDRLIVCSDGLHGTLSETEIARLVGESGAVPGQLLVDRALATEIAGQDNLTVIGIAYDEPDAGRNGERAVRGHARVERPVPQPA